MRLFIVERRILFCKRDGAGGSGGVKHVPLMVSADDLLLALA